MSTRSFVYLVLFSSSIVLAYIFKHSCSFYISIFVFIHTVISCLFLFTSQSSPLGLIFSSLVCCSRVLTTSGLWAALDWLLLNSPVLLMFGNSFFFNFISPAFCLSRISYCLMNPILWSKADVDSFILKNLFSIIRGLKGDTLAYAQTSVLKWKSYKCWSLHFFSIMSVTIKNQAK